MDDEEQPVYSVVATGERFQVVSETNRVIVVCRDEHSANEYAVLLNEAFRRGFKAGRRSARRTMREGNA